MSRLNRILSFRSSRTWSYGFAFFSTAFAWVASRWLVPQSAFPASLFFCAVILSAWYGGVGPGLLAAALSTLGFLIHHSVLGSLLYAASNLLLASLSTAQRNAKESLGRARDELDRTVQDLQKTNEALHAESRERKQTEESLRQAQADLAHANRVSSLGELTASVAHEVNQPIAAAVTSANSCIRWLQADVPNLDKARAAAERIVKDGTRAGEIVSRIRLLFEKRALQLELVDVNEVIEEMIVLLRGEAIRHVISVHTELATDLPRVRGDRVQLQQVMMNLLINSIDAMKAIDGRRELSVKSQRAENDQLHVSVHDTGIGLPPQQADQIFDAFFTTKPHGTGMGLRICRSIVETHGGRLWAGDNFPRGASFCFTLPAKLEAKE